MSKLKEYKESSCRRIHQNESSGEYGNIFKFIENPLNSIKQTTKIEVHTSYDLIYDGVLYYNNSPVTTPQTETVITKNVKKKNKKIGAKIFDINTSDYKKLTSNKRTHIIELFDNLDAKILKTFEGIHRNYLIKEVAYKTNVRLMTIVIKQSELMINFDRDVKIFDRKNLLKERAGYNNQNICYYMNISQSNEIDYVLKLFNELYKVKTDNSKNLFIDDLMSELTSNILKIDKTIKKKKVNKGIMFRGKRNFAILERRTYGINVRILKIDNNNKKLAIVGNSNTEPLCRSFKILNYEDINNYLDYIKESFELTKLVAIDVKNNIIDMHTKEKEVSV